MLGPLANTVTVAGTPPGAGPVTGTAQASVSLTSGPSIAVLRVPSSGTAHVGQTITYTLRVTNTGDVSLDAVESHDSTLGAVSLSQITLAVGEFATGALGCTVVEDDLPGPLVNTVVVMGTAPGSESVGSSSMVSIQLDEKQILLPVILKTQPLTYLFVTSDNTGGVSRLDMWRVSDNILV